ncbi:Lipase [Macleaya cordata]|uniref:Lipase n=1 Tax=Macleaya cordata TaxID=56857 RepID=A0A200R2M6_MACCD|nr:Lipase [Macleaya cordata]
MGWACPSSTTQPWNHLQADVIVRGYGGYNSRWALFLLHHIFPLISTEPPVATTVFFGANDAALLGRRSEKQHVPVEEYKENLQKIVHHLKERSPNMLVVLITPPPVHEEGRREYFRSTGEVVELPERTNEITGVYAKQCLEVAKDLGLPSIDLWSKMQEEEGWQTKFLSDGLHLTKEGNAIVYKEVVRVFSEAGFCASEMPLDFPHHSKIDGKNPEKAFQQQQCSSI